MRKRASGTEASELDAHVAGLQPGTTIRINCPRCHSAERTLSVSKADDGTVLWVCFRASCGFKGAKRDGRPPLVAVAHKERPSRKFTGDLRELTADEAALLATRVHFDEEDLQKSRVLYAPDASRYAFPVLDPMGRRHGYVLRSYTGATPKASTHMDDTESLGVSFYGGPRRDWIVAVEDIPSAVRVSRYVCAVALLGNGCGDDVVAAIRAVCPNVVFALDKDAYANSVRLARRHSMRFRKTRPYMIDEDFKDMTPQKLKEVCCDLLAAD